MLIGVSGKIGSGKNTAANLFAKHASLLDSKQIVHKYFAFKLKQIVEILTGIKMSQSFVDNYFSNGITDFTTDDKNIYIDSFQLTIGQLLQQIGTETFRDHFRKTVWVDSLFNDYDQFEKRNSIWIITDCRFTNEAEKIKELGGALIRINRPQIENSTTRDTQHPSEIALDHYKGFDYIIENDGDMDSLEEKVKLITKTILSVANSK